MVVLGAALVGSGWAVIRMTATPAVPAVPASQADGVRAQQKLWDLARRTPTTVILTERELNGLLAHHMIGPGNLIDVAATGVVVTLDPDGSATMLARVPLGDLMTAPPLSAVAAVLPRTWLESRVWLTIRARPHLEDGEGPPPRRYLTLDVEGLRVGRQGVPTMLLRILLSPEGLRVLHWRVPATIESIVVESRRVVVRSGGAR